MYKGSLLYGLALVVAGAIPAWAASPPPELNPSDPALRLWLKADTLVSAGLADGDPVHQWVDQSQYGTIMAPRTVSNPNGPLGGFPVEENPHLNFASINGNNVPTVRFDHEGDIFNTGDPTVDGSGSTDRLYQTNNLAPGFDPTDISDGSSLTTFAVFNPDITTSLNPNGSPKIGWETIFAKRGTLSCDYDFKIKNYPNFGNFVYVSYDSVEQYHSTVKPMEMVWHVSSVVIGDNPGNANVDTIDMLDDQSQSATQKMASIGVQTASGTPLTTIASRNPSTPEPFGIGGHSQNCCGEGETFAGNIAELIIFARKLTPQEFSDVENYLDAKYFAVPPMGVSGDYNGDGIVDAADYTVWRDHLGQLFTLPNENPAALTPGLVDGEDYNFWTANFGNTGSGGGALGAAVPEPATWALLCSMLFSAAPWSIRRR